MERGTIEVAPLAFMRGRTLNDSFIILDEAQNTSPEQMQMFLTRLGFGSKVVVTGDVTQIDLPREQASGLIQVQDILGAIDGIAFVRSRTTTSSATSSCSGSSRPTSATPRRPAPQRAPVIAVEVENRSGVGGRRRGGASRSPATCSPAEGIDEASSGIAFVAPDEIRELKREHLGIDEATDVLSFPIDGREPLPDGAAAAARRRRRSARRSSARSGARRSSTGCCTCSATTTAPRWKRARASTL